MTSLEKYKKLAGETAPTEFARARLFSPTDDQYQLPFIRRYFAKKINDNEIIEVDDENYKKLSGTLYILLSMKWKITGSVNTTRNNNIVTSEGIVEFNSQQIRLAEKTMPGISKKLPNLLEGYNKKV